MADIKDLVIYGAGGLGREILSLIRRDYADEWHVIGFVDDSEYGPEDIYGVRVYDKTFLDSHNVAVILAIGDPVSKGKIFSELLECGNITFPNIISNKAIVCTDTQLGKGNVITDFCWVSTNVTIGDGVLVNVATTIGHDSKIGDFVSIMPQCAISGKVNVGNSSLIGAKSFILQGKHIGQQSVVAAGSCVFRNVDDGETVWGNPAHTLIKSNKHRG